jgi:hypothetical protein
MKLPPIQINEKQIHKNLVTIEYLSTQFIQIDYSATANHACDSILQFQVHRNVLDVSHIIFPL